MYSAKYYKYLGVATGCVGLGLGLKYTTTKDNLQLSLRDNSVPAVKDEVYSRTSNFDFSSAIEDSRKVIMRKKELSGTPGVSVAVNVDGKTVWTEGFGLADVENEVPCTPLNVMRIASISKSITMAVLGRLWQQGSVDFDKPIQKYVPDYPVHSVDGEQVKITTRMLVSHLSGIRHYKKKENGNAKKETTKNQESENKVNGEGNLENTLAMDNQKNPENNKLKDSEKKDENNNKREKTAEPTTKETGRQRDDQETYEVFMTKRFKSVQEALDIFKNDELFHKPGTAYLYTTYGWTVISAVIESAAKSTFPAVMTEFFSQMGMKHTYLDYNDPIIPHRVRYYTRSKSGGLQNARIVDNSYKWAGGGYLSTVGDLVKFGDIMMYCFQHSEKDQPGYLKPEIVEQLWSVQTPTPRAVRGSGYGMGWAVVPHRHEFGWGDEQPMVVSHTGAAVGASSVLLLLPEAEKGKISPPAGITVAILGNLDNVNWEYTARDIAESFKESLSK